MQPVVFLSFLDYANTSKRTYIKGSFMIIKWAFLVLSLSLPLMAMERSKEKDYYAILELDKNASLDDIKTSFKRLGRQYHPDKNKEPGAEEKFKEIAEAYSILSDETKRRNYDRYKTTSDLRGAEWFVREVEMFFSKENITFEDALRLFDSCFDTPEQKQEFIDTSVRVLTSMALRACENAAALAYEKGSTIDLSAIRQAAEAARYMVAESPESPDPANTLVFPSKASERLRVDYSDDSADEMSGANGAQRRNSHAASNAKPADGTPEHNANYASPTLKGKKKHSKRQPKGDRRAKTEKDAQKPLAARAVAAPLIRSTKNDKDSDCPEPSTPEKKNTPSKAPAKLTIIYSDGSGSDSDVPLSRNKSVQKN